jgi:hypothetical protein
VAKVALSFGGAKNLEWYPELINSDGIYYAGSKN